MTPFLIKKLKTKLLSEKEFLEKEIANLENFPSFGEGKFVDEKEADEAEEFSTYLALKEEFKKRKKLVEEALRKIENKSYGFCKKCGQEIELEKLIADPTTCFCKSCQP